MHPFLALILTLFLAACSQQQIEVMQKVSVVPVCR